MTTGAAPPVHAAYQKAIDRVREAVDAVDPRLTETIDRAERTARAVQRTVVVVVGEVKQGKSSLINALLGHPDLSPVDVVVTTATYLVFGHDEGRHSATVQFADGRPPSDVDPATLPTWGTRAADAPVRNIDVAVDAPWLGDVVLIDTPGAGGLVAAHADAALEAAATASALLFVTDALSPMSGVELDFLSRAAESVQTVVFALTKIGQQPSWTDVLDENKRNIAQVAPRFADARWIAVDSVLAGDALRELGPHPTALDADSGDDDDPAATDALEDWEESGVGELLGVLRDDLAPATAALAAANVGRVARSVAEQAERQLVLRLGELELNPQLETAVSEHHDRLVELRDEGRTWGPRLEQNLGLLRIDTSRELANRVTARRDAWNERLRSLRKAPSETELTALLDEARQDLQAVGNEILALTRSRFRAVADHLFEELDDPEAVTTAIEALGSEVALPPPSRLPPDRPPSAKDAMDSYFGYMMGANMFSFLGQLVPGGAVLAGGAGMALRWWVGKDAAKQTDARTSILTWINQAESQIRAEVDRTTVNARYFLSEAFRTSLDRAIAETEEFLDASKRARAQSGQELKQRRAAIQNQQRQLSKRAATLDLLLSRPIGSLAPAASAAEEG